MPIRHSQSNARYTPLYRIQRYVLSLLYNIMYLLSFINIYIINWYTYLMVFYCISLLYSLQYTFQVFILKWQWVTRVSSRYYNVKSNRSCLLNLSFLQHGHCALNCTNDCIINTLYSKFKKSNNHIIISTVKYYIASSMYLLKCSALMISHYAHALLLQQL